MNTTNIQTNATRLRGLAIDAYKRARYWYSLERAGYIGAIVVANEGLDDARKYARAWRAEVSKQRASHALLATRYDKTPITIG